MLRFFKYSGSGHRGPSFLLIPLIRLPYSIPISLTGHVEEEIKRCGARLQFVACEVDQNLTKKVASIGFILDFKCCFVGRVPQADACSKSKLKH